MSVWDLFKIFVRIGATGFGGMVSLLGIVQQQVVERRKLVSQETMAEGLAVGQILPGPVVVNMVAYIGHRLRGWRGGLISPVALIAPPFLLMLILTPLYWKYNHTPELSGAFTAIGGTVIAIIVAATWRLGKNTLKGYGEALFAIIAMSAALLKINPALIILATGAVGMLFWRPAAQTAAPGTPPAPETQSAPDKLPPRGNQRTLRVCGAALLALVVLLALALWVSRTPELASLCLACLKVGTLVFGGGLVMIPLMQADVLSHGWLTLNQFRDAVALGQMTPGPLLVTVTFIGYKVSGFTGATLATICIFLPSVLMTLVLAGQLRRFRSNPWVQGFLNGVKPAAIGLIVYTAVTLAQTSLVDPWTMHGDLWPVGICVVALGLLLKLNLDAALVILGSGLLGLVIYR